MSRLQIREDDLTGRKIADFLREHLENIKDEQIRIAKLDDRALLSSNRNHRYNQHRTLF